MRPALGLLLLCTAATVVAQSPDSPSPVPPPTSTTTAPPINRQPTLDHTFTAVKMATPPTIDGAINDDEWKDIQPMTGMVDGMTGTPSPEPALFWLGYDDKYIYFAARLHDSQPGEIKQTEYRQNSSLSGDDTVQLDIDPYGALTDWSHFTINPKGATRIQIAGGRASKQEWVGEFVAKARVTPDGWEAEAKIPWALMKLPGSGKRDVRFDFDRYLARTNRAYDWTNTASGDLRGVGMWHAVEIPKIQEDKILQFLPYTYQGIDNKGAIANGGLDLKMPVTDQINLVGTVNPDFRNIENQILSIDFSRFERLAGESRPFFQEGQQYYGSALIATQRIKDFDTGINLYGKVNSKLAVGLLNTSNFGTENDVMTTWQYSPNQVSNVRMSLTDLDSKDVKNRGYLLAYNNQVSKTTNVFLRGMSTDDATIGNGEERLAQINVVQGELIYNGGYRQISPNFKPRLGFAPEVNYKGLNSMVMWDHVIKAGPVAEISMDAYGSKYDHFAGGNYRRGTGGDFSIANRAGTQLSGNADFSQFEGSNDHTYNLNLVNPRSDPYRNWQLGYTWGEIESSSYRSLTIGSSYRPTNKLQLSLSSQFVRFMGDDKQIILGGTFDLGNNRSISGRVVQGQHDTNAYVALQRSGGSGIEYFLILGDPNALKFRRSLILKVTYPLQMFLSKHSH
jgi:hypothetical protein